MWITFRLFLKPYHFLPECLKEGISLDRFRNYHLPHLWSTSDVLSPLADSTWCWLQCCVNNVHCGSRLIKRKLRGETAQIIAPMMDSTQTLFQFIAARCVVMNSQVWENGRNTQGLQVGKEDKEGEIIKANRSSSKLQRTSSELWEAIDHRSDTRGTQRISQWVSHLHTF